MQLFEAITKIRKEVTECLYDQYAGAVSHGRRVSDLVISTNAESRGGVKSLLKALKDSMKG